MSVSNIPLEMQDKIFNCKSVAIYRKWQEKFIEYIQEHDLSEDVNSMLSFFTELAKSYAPSTLWQAYSCLNKYYVTYKSWRPLKEVPLLTNYIKTIEKESAGKKQSLTLSKEQLFFFLNNAPNDPKELVRKAVSIVAFYGGLRCAELVALEFTDIVVNSESITVFIRSSKTDPKGHEKFYFLIPKANNDICSGYTILKNYIYAVPKKTGRLFQNYNLKARAFAGQPMGRNTIASIPSFIASFLNLESPKSYTGHCFRRSSATTLADSGASRLTLKRQYRWRSDTVAESYIVNSKKHKNDVATSLRIESNVEQRMDNAQTNSKGSNVVNINNCSNVVINL